MSSLAAHPHVIYTGSKTPGTGTPVAHAPSLVWVHRREPRKQPIMSSKGRARGTSRSCSGARGGQLYELPAWEPIDGVWLGRGVGAGSLKILAGVLVHRAARPLRGSVSCGSGWSVPCVSIQLTLSQQTRSINRTFSPNQSREQRAIVLAQLTNSAFGCSSVTKQRHLPLCHVSQCGGVESAGWQLRAAAPLKCGERPSSRMGMWTRQKTQDGRRHACRDCCATLRDSLV